MRNRSTHAALIIAAGTALVLLWIFNRPPTGDTVASPAAVTAKFEEIVFGNDFGPDSERVVKWGTSIKIVIATAIPDRLRQDLSDILSQARQLTGIDMRLAKKGGRNSIYVHYAPHAQFVPILRRFYPSRSKSLDWLRSASCFFSGIPRSYEYKWAVIGIADDLGEKETRSCIFEEIYQGLGPGKNSNALPPSIAMIDRQFMTSSGCGRNSLRTFRPWWGILLTIFPGLQVLGQKRRRQFSAIIPPWNLSGRTCRNWHRSMCAAQRNCRTNCSRPGNRLK